MDPLTSSIVFVLIALAIVVVIAVAFIYDIYWAVQSLRVSVDNEAWQSLAEEMDLTFEEGISGTQPSIVGVLEGTAVSVVTNFESRSRHSVPVTEISATIASECMVGVEIETRGGNYRFLLAPPDELHPELNEYFTVRNAAEDQLAFLEKPTVRNALLSAHAICGQIEIDASEVIYRPSALLNDPQRLRECIEAIAAVARTLEDAARQSPGRYLGP